MPIILPPDDASISDDEMLYVRVYPCRDALQATQRHGEFRPMSGALRRHGDALSADLGSLCTPEQTQQRANNASFHVAAFTAGDARAAGCIVTRDPVAGNDAHALVWGDNTADGSLSMRQSKQIAQRSRIVLLGS